MLVTAVLRFEGPADRFIAAVGIRTGAAHLYTARGALAAVLIVDTVFNIAADARDLFLFHSYHSFSSCEFIMSMIRG